MFGLNVSLQEREETDMTCRTSIEMICVNEHPATFQPDHPRSVSRVLQNMGRKQPAELICYELLSTHYPLLLTTLAPLQIRLVSNFQHNLHCHMSLFPFYCKIFADEDNQEASSSHFLPTFRPEGKLFSTDFRQMIGN